MKTVVAAFIKTVPTGFREIEIGFGVGADQPYFDFGVSWVIGLLLVPNLVRCNVDG